jgi:hypothetical protein
MEHWNNGLIKKTEMENRKNGILGKGSFSFIAIAFYFYLLTHYAIIPLFHHSVDLS